MTPKCSSFIQRIILGYPRSDMVWGWKVKGQGYGRAMRRGSSSMSAFYLCRCWCSNLHCHCVHASLTAVLSRQTGFAGFRSSSTPSYYVLLRYEKGQCWRKMSGEKVQWCRVFEAGWPSCCPSLLKTSTGPHPFFNHHWGKWSCGCLLTEFVDCDAERGSRRYHPSSTVWSVKELEQPWHELVLVFIVSQSAVATKTPREDPILTINDHLKHTTNHYSYASR